MCDEISRRKSIIRHIQHVRDNCLILGESLIEVGDVELGHQLIANGHIHDYSKFTGVEWLYLNDAAKKNKPELFQAAHTQHVTSNLHHPEAWAGGIKDMSDVYLAEFVCDVSARSSEFGTDIRAWIKEVATEKYKFTTSTRVYNSIRKFLDLLLEQPFK